MSFHRLVLFSALCVAAAPALGDEGMWTYDNFPSAQVAKKYGFAPDQKWLDHLRLSSARTGIGCSGSFVSGDGLVMTNHHCVSQCVAQLSTKERDLEALGFYAAQQKDELRCPTEEINQLVQITDVTARMGKATQGLSGEPFQKALHAEMAKVEKECTADEKTRCDVVTLYHGGQYHLYRYHRFQDVRLVFAPEFQIAFFGGDPDNFNFPRYDLDVGFLRAYENGAPAKTDEHLRWNAAGPKEGELTFVSGHPGSTSRLLTVAELDQERDQGLPHRLMLLSEMRGMLNEFANRGPEQKRIATPLIFGIENGIKALRGEREALVDKAFTAKLVKAEADLRKKVNADPAKKKLYGGAWDEIAKAVNVSWGLDDRYGFIEGRRPAGFQSQLFGIARGLVRLSAEKQKPNEQRLREYVDSSLPQVQHHLFSTAPIYDELEIATLGWSLSKLREQLGADDPFVRKVFGADSPEEIAARVVKGTQLKDVEFRKKLLAGGWDAVQKSDDPMVRFALLVDGDARALRAQYEEKVESVIKRNSELVARARFAAYGTSAYPDATGTLRLSFGTVKGWEDHGKVVAPFTRIGGAFTRATGRPPFDLAKSWLDAKAVLDPETPFNFVTDNDIVGGNSGSPMVNKAGEAIGLVFDGNILSLGGSFGFDEAVNRTVAVDTAALTEALKKIYKADRILDELGQAPSAPKGAPAP